MVAANAERGKTGKGCAGKKRLPGRISGDEEKACAKKDTIGYPRYVPQIPASAKVTCGV
jgi:hypothetical protein